MGVEIGVGVAVGVYKDKVIVEVQKQVTPWTHNYNFVATTVQNGILVPIQGSFTNSSADALVQTNAWNAMQIYVSNWTANLHWSLSYSPIRLIDWLIDWLNSTQNPKVTGKQQNVVAFWWSNF